MIRSEVMKLKKLDRLTHYVMDEFIELLDKIEQPVSYEEAEILIKLFPDYMVDGCGVDWSLLHLIETVDNFKAPTNVNIERYENLIRLCSSVEWKLEMKMRFENYKNKNSL